MKKLILLFLSLIILSTSAFADYEAGSSCETQKYLAKNSLTAFGHYLENLEETLQTTGIKSIWIGACELRYSYAAVELRSNGILLHKNSAVFENTDNSNTEGRIISRSDVNVGFTYLRMALQNCGCTPIDQTNF